MFNILEGYDEQMGIMYGAIWNNKISSRYSYDLFEEKILENECFTSEDVNHNIEFTNTKLYELIDDWDVEFIQQRSKKNFTIEGLSFLCTKMVRVQNEMEVKVIAFRQFEF